MRQPAEPDHHAAPAGLRHGQCRRRSVQRRAGRRRASRAAAAASIPTARPRRLRARWRQHYGVALGVIISDSFGRAWRRGTCGVAIGAAGLPSLIDLRGQPDLFGRTLEVSIIGFADEIAAAASLLQGQAAEAQPVVLVRGLTGRRPMRRPPNWCARRRRICSGDRRRTVRRRRRRQAGARPQPRAAGRGTAGRLPTPATISSISACRISPDIDTVMYTLAGAGQPANSAGAARDETWSFMETTRKRSAARPGSAWATAILPLHVERTRRLQAGETLSAITADLCRGLALGRASCR